MTVPGLTDNQDIPRIHVRDPSEDIGNDIRKVEPHQRQEDFLRLPDDVFEALFGGAAYGGKSFILTLLPLIRGFYKQRGFKGIIFRRNYNDLEKEVIRLSHEYYPATGGIYNETKHSWRWPEYGSYMDFGHINHMSDLKRQYDTAQYNYGAFDELTHFDEAMYIYIAGSRIRPGSDFRISIVRNGTNPGGVGQKFVFDRFVKPCETGYKILRDKKTGLLRTFIPSFLQDNPYGLLYDPLYAQKLEMLPENEKRAKKYGDWHAFEGSYFTEFRPIRFPHEPEIALHVIEPFGIPEWWPRILSIDWGKRAMCHAMWGAISPNGRLYVYRERHWIGKDVPFWASEIKEISHNENIIQTVLCGSAWQDRGTETISDQFQKYSGLVATSTENTPNTRVPGWQVVHDMLRWEPVVTLKAQGEFYNFDTAMHIFRNFGEEALIKYKMQFMDETEEKNLPKIQFFSTCPLVTETIPLAVHDDEKNVEDVKEFDGDDPLDNLRYLSKAAMRYLTGTDEEIVRIRAVNNAMNHLATTQDVTSFYRKMEHIEAAKVIKGAVRKSRFSRR